MAFLKCVQDLNYSDELTSVELATSLFTVALMAIIILISLHILLAFLKCLVINLLKA